MFSLTRVTGSPEGETSIHETNKLRSTKQTIHETIHANCSDSDDLDDVSTAPPASFPMGNDVDSDVSRAAGYPTQQSSKRTGTTKKWADLSDNGSEDEDYGGVAQQQLSFPASWSPRRTGTTKKWADLSDNDSEDEEDFVGVAQQPFPASPSLPSADEMEAWAKTARSMRTFGDVDDVNMSKYLFEITDPGELTATWKPLLSTQETRVGKERLWAICQGGFGQKTAALYGALVQYFEGGAGAIDDARVVEFFQSVLDSALYALDRSAQRIDKETPYFSLPYNAERRSPDPGAEYLPKTEDLEVSQRFARGMLANAFLLNIKNDPLSLPPGIFF